MVTASALITGGAGFVATHLARMLAESGQFGRIISLDIRQPQLPVKGVMYHTHDVRQPFPQNLDGHYDIVFNLAAVHRTPGHEDVEYYDTNVGGAINCVAFCERNGVGTTFFTSSISVYGPSENPLDETAGVNPESAYGRSKKLAEDIHRAWQGRAPGRRLRIVRPAVIFGEGENGNYTLLAKLMRRGVFVFPGRKDTLKSGGYVKELVRSMAFALDRPEPNYLYNFADRKVPTAAEICDAFCFFGGMKPPLGTVPVPVMQAGAAVCSMLNALGFKNPFSWQRVRKLVYSTNIVPARLIADGYPFAYSLQTALGDWMATDEAIRPAATDARPVVVAPPDLDVVSVTPARTPVAVGAR